MKLDTFSFPQALPTAHATTQLAIKAWSTDAKRQAPAEAFVTGMTKVLAPVCAMKMAVAETLTLPLRAVVGTSVRRQLAGRPPEAENFMHRGLLGAFGDGLRAGIPRVTGAVGSRLAALVGAVKRDPSEGRQQAWGANAASVGARIGAFLQAGIEFACGAANVVLEGLTLASALSLTATSLAIAVGVGTFYAYGQAFSKGGTSARPATAPAPVSKPRPASDFAFA